MVVKLTKPFSDGVAVDIWTYKADQTSNYYLDSYVELYSSNKIFLNPSDNWKEADAKFIIHTWNASGDNKQVDLVKSSINDKWYECDISNIYDDFLFARRNPNGDDWWGQSGDLTKPTDNKILYTVINWHDNGSGWSSIPTFSLVE